MNRRRAIATLLPVVFAISCRAVSQAYGTDAASAAANGDAFFRALEYRFTDVVRTPKFSNARMRIARYAMTPSKIENDTAVWTARVGSTGVTRELQISGSMIGSHYTFTPRAQVAMPTTVGDSRHAIRLSPLQQDDYMWITEVDQSIGTMPPARAASIFTALFAAMERSENAIRNDYREAFPNAVRAWGRLYTIDSLKTISQGDGSSRVSIRLRFTPEQLRATSPAMAKFFDKYVSNAKYKIQLTDKGGALWFEVMSTAANVVEFHFRSHGGALQPLLGAARAMPDTMQISVDASTKVSFFNVGVTEMRGEFVHIHTADEQAWALRFTTEPQWHLPLAARQFLKSPLRRAFEGRGIVFRMGIREGPNGQTLLSRRFDVAVRESTIMRFLGMLGFTAMDDFAGVVEAEENRFFSEGFAALRADLKGLKPAAP